MLRTASDRVSSSVSAMPLSLSFCHVITAMWCWLKGTALAVRRPGPSLSVPDSLRAGVRMGAGPVLGDSSSSLTHSSLLCCFVTALGLSLK